MIRPDKDDGNGWSQYQRLVLDSLKRLERQSEDHYSSIAEFKEKVATDFTEVKSEIKALKVMSGVVGTISGTISGALASVALLFKKG